MVVFPPGAQAVQRRNSIPEQVRITQSAALFLADCHAEFKSSLLPELEQSSGLRPAPPGSGFVEDLDFNITGVTVHRAAHFAGAGQGEQGGFSFFEDFGIESAK